MKFRDYSNYEVYEDGRIFSYNTNSFLKPKTNNGGYQTVRLADDNGKTKLYLLHRVVWEAVTGEPIPKCFEINHISEAKDENFFANLNLMTPKDNINWGSGISRRAKKRSKQVGAFKNNELVMSFPSIAECGRQGFSQGNVSACCNGKRKTHKGFEWRYI